MSFQKKRKSHVFDIWKKRKIRILELWFSAPWHQSILTYTQPFLFHLEQTWGMDVQTGQSIKR